jgi:DnaK suppressor protein
VTQERGSDTAIDSGQLRAELQTRLRAERVRLEMRLNELHGRAESDALHAHPGEEKDDDLGVEARLGDSLDAHFNESLAQIDAALAMIETDEFGTCRDCERAIPIERLMILPQAQRCVACAERASR